MIWYDCHMSIDKKAVAQTQSHLFELEVKGQHHIGIMNKHKTISHGERPMCLIWYDNVKANRSYRKDTKTCQI